MSRSITLGGASYPLAPLTMADMQRLFPLFPQYDRKFETSDQVTAAFSIITIAVQRGSPHMTVPMVQDIRGITLAEMIAAINEIGLEMGLYKLKDETLGEAQAEAPTSAS